MAQCHDKTWATMVQSKMGLYCLVLCDNRKYVINRSNIYYRNRDNDFFSIVIGVNCCEMIDSL